MSSKSRDISRVLQDTFDELQSELIRQQVLLEEDGGTGEQEDNIAGIVTELSQKGGFEVLEMIGAGGMGAVVKARDQKLRRTVALKFLPPDFLSHPEDAAELRREAELASSIAHENVVQIFSWHEVDNVPFYAMEYIEGETVDQMVMRRDQLDPIEAMRIASEAARGVEALHRLGIIHRDIKPHNILISKEGRVKITDFGISRTTEMISDEAKNSSMIAGTPNFMSPEQARGEAATRHSDIYSLGATLYYMLTGRPPVEPAPDIRTQIQMVRDGVVTPIRQVMPKLSPKVAKLIMKALSPISSKRPWDIAAFRQELEEVFLSMTLGTKSGFSLFLSRRQGIILMISGIAMGLLLGSLMGYKIALAYLAPPDLKTDHLEALARFELVQLEIISELDPSEKESGFLVKELKEALDKNEVGRLVELVPSAVRVSKEWNLVLTAKREAADPKSPLQDQALIFLTNFESGDIGVMKSSIEEWYLLWARTIPKQKRTLPNPVQPEPTPAPQNNLLDIPGPEPMIPPEG
jgi:serine/threonine protein kinase